MGADTDLRGRVALVTGAGRGLGRAHALALAARGACVVVNDLGTGVAGDGADSAIAAAVVREIEAGGGVAHADYSDISSFAGAARVVAHALDRCGRLDILVNNAGIVAVGDDIGHLDAAALQRMLAVHLYGTLGTIRAAWPHMRARGHGRIVNTVSEVAFPTPRAPGLAGVSYPAAKAAVWSATLAIARAGAAYGITCNAVSPGAHTRMSADLLATGVSAGLDLDPAHVARVVCYLAADAAADITGKVIHAAGGHLREYEIIRRADTDLVRRLQRALRDG